VLFFDDSLIIANKTILETAVYCQTGFSNQHLAQGWFADLDGA